MYNLSYSNFNKLKLFLFTIIFIGSSLLLFNYYKTFSINHQTVFNFIKNHKSRFFENEKKLSNKNYIKKDKNIIIHNLLHKLKNRYWSSIYITVLFFTGISFGSFIFLLIQYISQSGWSIILIRIMESISSFFPYGAIILLIILIMNCLEYINMFHWMDKSLYDIYNDNYDYILYIRSLYLNKPFFIIRSIIHIILCTFFIKKIKYLSKKLDNTKNIKYQNKIYTISVISILCLSITSIMIGWDWIMSLDPHWISTLFSWYILSGYLLTGIITITLISIYLNNKKILLIFNKNHLHDLSNYIFAGSMLWSYLWFCQFLLYWYSNIPEEVIYFIHRSEIYNNIHFWMLIPNLIFPLLGLMSSYAKKNTIIVTIISFVILIGQYINIYNLVIPGSVGPFYGFGMAEIGSILLFTGIFLLIIINNIIKNPLLPKGNKFFHESEMY